MSGGARRGRSLACSLLVVVVALGAIAGRARAAEDPEAQARRHFGRGKQLYDERKYREAAEEFEAGYGSVAKPGFLLNIGHSYRRAGELKKAKRYYEMFLEKDSGSPQRGEVRVYIKTIDDALADQDNSSPPPSSPSSSSSSSPSSSPSPSPEPTPPAATAATAPDPAPSAPRPLIEVCRDRDPAPAAASPRWPWVVSGAAVVIAGGIASAIVLMGRSGKNEPCGSLGCLNER